jgi:hypothetical protein
MPVIPALQVRGQPDLPSETLSRLKKPKAEVEASDTVFAYHTQGPAFNPQHLKKKNPKTI